MNDCTEEQPVDCPGVQLVLAVAKSAQEHSQENEWNDQSTNNETELKTIDLHHQWMCLCKKWMPWKARCNNFGWNRHVDWLIRLWKNGCLIARLIDWKACWSSTSWIMSWLSEWIPKSNRSLTSESRCPSRPSIAFCWSVKTTKRSTNQKNVVSNDRHE